MLKRNLVTFAFGLLLVFALWFPVQDGDVFFYLNLGRVILETGSIPETDPYLYTVTDWYVHHEWLAYVLFRLSEIAGGITGVTAMKTVLWLSAFSVLIVSARNWKVQEGPAFVLIFLAALVCSHRFIERASLFSDFFLCLMTAHLLRPEPPSKRMLWALPMLFAIWVNLHPGYVIGLALYSMYVLTRIWRGEAWRLPLLSLGLSYLACLLNPKFIEGALYPVRTAFKPEWQIHRKINFEWMPTFKEPLVSAWEVQALIALLAMTLALLSWATLKRRSVPVFAWAAFALYLYLAQDASRFMSTSALGLALVSLYAIKESGVALPTRWNQKLILSLTILFCGMAAWVATQGYPSSAGHRRLGTGIEEESFPTKVVELIKRSGLEGRIFNQYEWGSYLVWSLNLEKSLFIHTHVDDPTFLADAYYGMSRSEEIFRRTVQEYDIRYFLLDRKILSIKPTPGLLEFLKDWKVLHQDETAILWGR